MNWHLRAANIFYNLAFMYGCNCHLMGIYAGINILQITSRTHIYRNILVRRRKELLWRQRAFMEGAETRRGN